MLHDGIGLTGEHRLVDLEVRGDQHLRVGCDLLAGAQVDDVVEHELVDGERRDCAVPHGGDLRGADDDETVERSLGAELLHDSDQRVGDDDASEQGVAVGAARDHHREQRADQGVEAGEHVGADDLAGRARGRRRHIVDGPVGDPLRDLGGRQT